jgi:hypothetical protein
MEPRNKNGDAFGAQTGGHQNPLPQEISDEQRALNASAHTEAEKDIEADAELSAHSPNDDLDEGETARLGEDIPGIL